MFKPIRDNSVRSINAALKQIYNYLKLNMGSNNGSGSGNAIQEYTGDFPPEGNIWIDPTEGKIKYKIVNGTDTIVYTVQVEDSVIFPGEVGDAPTSFSEFEAMVSTLNDRRYENNPISAISYQPDTWKARQTHFAQVIENPSDPDSLIMFYGGGSVLAGGFAIGRADALKSDPYTWTDYPNNPIFTKDTIGLGVLNIIGVDDAWWNPTLNRFELLCCTYAGDGSHLARYISNDGYNFTYQVSIILPTGDETHVGNSGILRDGDTWYCAYTYRTTTETLPGVRLASSTDGGTTWTKHGNAITLGPSSYDNQYMEGVQFLKIGNDYILNYGSSGNIGGEIVYSGSLASSTSPLGPYTKSSINPFFENSVSGWDETQVSTIVVFSVTTPWLFFYQGTASTGDYNMALWSMGIATLY